MITFSLTKRSLLALISLSALVLSACGPSLYSLPEPPPKEEWKETDDSVASPDEAAIKRFLDAKRVAIRIYSAMIDEDWDRVVDNMSQETRAFLEEASPSSDAKATLASKELQIDGETIPFDPISDFFIADLADIVDTLDGQQEEETEKRKELFVIGADNRARKVLFIYEEGTWRLHSPFVRTPTIKVK